MAQILLNDPNRAGGSSALDLRLDIGTIGEYNAKRLAMWAADVNAMFTELYTRLGFPIGTLVPFTTVISYNGINGAYMPSQSVTQQLNFTVGSSPVAYSETWVRLVADGNAGHAPTFTGFTVTGTWVNTAGVENVLRFEYNVDGVDGGAVVTIGAENAASAVPGKFRPSIASLSLAHGSNPTLTIATGGALPLNTAAVPPSSAFTVTTTQGATISGVSVSANAITLSLRGTVAVGDTVTLSYAPPPLNSPYATHGTFVQDTGGNQLAAFGATPVTVT